MSTQEINKAFHELAGKCWHKPGAMVGECLWCDQIIDKINYNPDYAADPRLVIEVMRERKDWVEFSAWLISGLNNNTSLIMELFIDLIMDTSGKLALLALEWIGRKE